MAVIVKLTANFERNLEEIEVFLDEVDATQAYDRLLDELTDTLIPNLERFPAIGRLFLERPVGSVEAANCANTCLRIIWFYMRSLVMSFTCFRSGITVSSPSILSRSGR